MTEYVQDRRRLESITERDDRHLRAAYYGLVAEVDANLGRLVGGAPGGRLGTTRPC